MGLTISGYPIRSAASHTPATVVALACRGLVAERHVLVMGERLAGGLGQRGRRLVADPDDPRPGGGKPAGEVRHLGRVPGRNHDDRCHCASTSSTRIPLTMRCNASRTTSVRGSRTMTYPSPS